MNAGQQIDIEVLADPESCQRTAAQLARLGGACVLVGGRLGRYAQVSPDDLGGLSGGVYRQSVAGAAATCDQLAGDCAELADGLADYARDVAEVRRLMGRARHSAAPWLTTCDWAIWSPVRTPDPADTALSRRWEAWHDAVGWWRQARDLEDLAEQRWLHVLGRAVAPEGADPAGSEDLARRPDGGRRPPERPDSEGPPEPAAGQPPAPDTDPPVTPIDDDGTVGPQVITVPGDGPQPRPEDREVGAERVPQPHADHKKGEPMAEPVPVDLPVTWAIGTGLGGTGLDDGLRDPLTHPEPTDPGPPDGHGAVR